MMINPTNDSTTIHYSAKNNTMVSGKIGQHVAINKAQQVKTTILHNEICQQHLTSNIQREIYVWLPKLPSVYNFTLHESRRSQGILYPLYIYPPTKKILFL